MTTVRPETGDYDDYATSYAAFVTRREQAGPDGDPYGLLLPLLDLLGNMAGRRVLDAGCGEGYLARALAARGAHVTGIDLAPRLIELARAKDPDASIDYQVADLSRPLPTAAGRFDAVGSYLVLNDVRDYRGFAATVAASLKPGGRLALALNNPYSSVTDRHVTDYFDSGAVSRYRGLWEAGIQTYYHHRTLENYLDAFHDGGPPPHQAHRRHGSGRCPSARRLPPARRSLPPLHAPGIHQPLRLTGLRPSQGVKGTCSPCT